MTLLERQRYQREEREFIAEVDPDLHELLEDEHRCRSCGCSEHLACPEGCWWVEHDLCSACAADAAINNEEASRDGHRTS